MDRTGRHSMLCSCRFLPCRGEKVFEVNTNDMRERISLWSIHVVGTSITYRYIR
jgi:hypothetical protein